MKGSTYVGYVSKALKGLDITDIEKRADLTEGGPAFGSPKKEKFTFPF